MTIIPNVIDIYHGNPIDFAEVAKAGIWGCIHKAKQGLNVSDKAYRRRQQAAKDVGLLWGGYDFATGDNVADNVTSFLNYANLGPNDLACLDFEDDTHSQMSANQAYEFLDRVHQKRGVPCLIYGGNRIREQINPHDPKWIEMAKTVPLWQCRYIKLQPEDNDELFRLIPPIPPWPKNFLLQYTGDGVGPHPHTINGLQNGADLDIYLGSKEALTANWAGQPTPTV